MINLSNEVENELMIYLLDKCVTTVTPCITDFLIENRSILELLVALFLMLFLGWCIGFLKSWSKN